MSSKARNEDEEHELEALLEAARRATWDALHGARHLRSGRFRPDEVDVESERAATAEQDNAPDDALRRG